MSDASRSRPVRLGASAGMKFSGPAIVIGAAPCVALARATDQMLELKTGCPAGGGSATP